MDISHEWAQQQAQRHHWRRWLMHQWIRKFAFRALVQAHIEGVEQVPSGQIPTIIMMNHTFTVDGVVVMGAVKDRFVVPMVKIENMEHPFIGFLARHYGAFGVHRGEIDRTAIKIALAMLEAGEALLIAPEGTRQSALQYPHDGLAYLALKSNAVVVPAALWNGESWWYDIKRPWRRTHIELRFGKAFRLRQDSKRAPREMLQAMTHEMMLQLAQLLPMSYRGVYTDAEMNSPQYLAFLP